MGGGKMAKLRPDGYIKVWLRDIPPQEYSFTELRKGWSIRGQALHFFLEGRTDIYPLSAVTLIQVTQNSVEYVAQALPEQDKVACTYCGSEYHFDG